jgi:deazaflavin-dependent oxidoreductase (nitroreductase family)
MTTRVQQTLRTPPRAVVRTFWAVHRAIYRLSGGRLGPWRPKPGKRFGVMGLTTLGRRSGDPRLVMAGYFEDGPNLVTLAMNGWAETQPAWWLNLRADPKASVMLATGPRAVRARAATGAERDRLWDRFDDFPGWGDHLDVRAAQRSMETPIVVLEPREPEAGVAVKSRPDRSQPTRKEVKKMTGTRLIRWTGLSAVVAGLLFVVVQPIHPPDTLASVTTEQWAIVHYATLAMTILFAVGITGIYARQVEETGWLGLAGVVTLNLALIITAMMVFIEAFISPVLARRDPEYVEALLALVSGTEIQVDLGALPLLWSVSGVLFPLGCLLVGIAIIRARILPRLAAGIFAFGLPVAVVVVSLLPNDLHRLGAVPVGVGLAWLGYALWADTRPRNLVTTAAEASVPTPPSN